MMTFFDKLIFRVGRHRHPMHESEQVLQRKASVFCKYHTEVGHSDRDTDVKKTADWATSMSGST
jgi:hypothetical protein